MHINIPMYKKRSIDITVNFSSYSVSYRIVLKKYVGDMMPLEIGNFMAKLGRENLSYMVLIPYLSTKH